MAIIECEALINAPIERVYQVSQDYSVRYEWDPFPEHIELLQGAVDVAKGVRARVKAKNGLMMDVEFVQVLPPTRAAIVMVRGPLYLKKFAGSWIFEARSSQVTQVKFRYVFTMRWWSIPIISETLAALYFQRVAQARLAGLKTYCEK